MKRISVIGNEPCTVSPLDLDLADISDARSSECSKCVGSISKIAVVGLILPEILEKYEYLKFHDSYSLSTSSTATRAEDCAQTSH